MRELYHLCRACPLFNFSAFPIPPSAHPPFFRPFQTILPHAIPDSQKSEHIYLTYLCSDLVEFWHASENEPDAGQDGKGSAEHPCRRSKPGGWADALSGIAGFHRKEETGDALLEPLNNSVFQETGREKSHEVPAPHAGGAGPILHPEEFLETNDDFIVLQRPVLIFDPGNP